MGMRTRFYRLALAGLLFCTGGIAVAVEPISAGDADGDVNLCAPFQDGKVDESLLASMLTAAENGHLYRIQTATSKMGFCVHSQVSEIEGEFKDFKGGLALQPVTNGDGQAMVVVNTNSLYVDGKLIEKLIKGESFFDVEHNPEILFVSKGFEWTSARSAELRGDLTLRGITRPVVFKVTLTTQDGAPASNAEKILVKATTEIDRTAFGMGALPSVVDSKVRLCMTVEALKYRPDSV